MKPRHWNDISAAVGFEVDPGMPEEVAEGDEEAAAAAATAAAEAEADGEAEDKPEVEVFTLEKALAMGLGGFLEVCEKVAESGMWYREGVILLRLPMNLYCS